MSDRNLLIKAAYRALFRIHGEPLTAGSDAAFEAWWQKWGPQRETLAWLGEIVDAVVEEGRRQRREALAAAPPRQQASGRRRGGE